MTDQDQNEFVTFVIPCLNEEKTLGKCITEIREVIDRIGKPASIIVADNGSTDGSQALARSLDVKVVEVAIRGYGAALMHGCSSARGQYIVIGDSDGSYDFGESVPMLNKLDEGYELVVGTRFRGRIMLGAMPWKNRYFGNPFLTAFLNVLYQSGISDAHSGLRAFTQEAFKRMALKSTGMEFASEMIVKASLLQLKITEVPITLYPDGRGRKPHLRPWHDGWRHMRFLLLYSPIWLYFIPGALMLLLGIITNVALNAVPSDQFVVIGRAFLGTHWTVPATLSAVLGMQLIWLGYFSTLYSVNNGLYPSPRWFDFVHNHIVIERTLIFGIGLIVLGSFLDGFILVKWILSNYGKLEEVRLAIFGMMWIVLGMEIISNGFLFDLMNSTGGVE